MDFKSFGFSDTGKTHERNEDSYLCNEKAGLFLLADGMGGHASGQTASQLAVESVEEFVVRSRSEQMQWPTAYQKELTKEQSRLLAAASFANIQIRAMALKNTSMEGMGTTLLGAIIEGNHLAILNVGDSRLYRIREGGMKQITQDHTLVGAHQRAGKLTKDGARGHPQRHILTSALGTRERPKMNVSLAHIRQKDLYLICSDGLNDMLDDGEILAIINSVKDKSLYKIGLSLVLKANLAGGLDNVTVILISF